VIGGLDTCQINEQSMYARQTNMQLTTNLLKQERCI
jgi:hypothetical protein